MPVLPVTQSVETERSLVQSQPRQFSEVLSQNKNYEELEIQFLIIITQSDKVSMIIFSHLYVSKAEAQTG
jgi:hypothetical protein